MALRRAAALGCVCGCLLAGSPAAAGDPPHSPNTQLYMCKPGPWGRVQWHYLHIEAPDWIVAGSLLPHSQPRWFFPGASGENVKHALSEAGVDIATVDRWLSDPRAVLNGPESITIFPGARDIESLSGTAREIIYRELAKSPVNEYYANPVCIFDAGIEDWLGKRKVRPEIVDLIKRLCYRQGNVLCFSDFPVLLGYAQNDAEVMDFAKLITRKRAVMAYLLVGPGDDMEKLEAYWSAVYRRKDVLPILTSVSQLPDGGRLGLSHLLPPQPRKLIYTYPTLDLATTGRLPDCHWTTFNFFSYNPQNVYLDLRLAANRLLDAYDRVDPPYKYGDALVFLNRDGDAVHSCVYLCDDLVFTKNGEAISAPWMIAQLEDVRRLYGRTDSQRIQGFRRRWDQEK